VRLDFDRPKFGAKMASFMLLTVCWFQDTRRRAPRMEGRSSEDSLQTDIFSHFESSAKMDVASPVNSSVQFSAGDVSRVLF
jgi:hypothetical protein